MTEKKYCADIGLEVHVELATRTKMFCGCAVVDTTTAEPNSAVCPVCMGLPGALPVINQGAVEFGIQAALALGCQVAEASIFARKNYFYPDLPKGYQISQYEQPLAVNGRLPIKAVNGWSEIRIRRVHLEEDTGKLIHIHTDQDNYSLVDLNRCGVPLLEIVSEPDMHDVEEVRAYCFGLRRLLRQLGVTSGDMEKGAMRFEANLSLRPAGEANLGTRVEIKNLNSFRTLERALLFQIKEQTQTLIKGEKVKQQTLGWNEREGKTQPQRNKEEAEDYRYFPEPDLPPLLIEKSWMEELKKNLPELPFNKYRRYAEMYELTVQDIERLIEEKETADFFEACLLAAPQLKPRFVANWIVGELFGWMNEHGKSMSEVTITPAMLAELLTMLEEKQITPASAKEMLVEMLISGNTASVIFQEKGLKIISNVSYIRQSVKEVLLNNPAEVEQYLGGKDALMNFFFGQVMTLHKGSADPQIVNSEINTALNQLKAGIKPENL
jgi:aspartyl-tRNA(Asn)/glutamyl-tRNA(Gln) amidotransferase subunit B